MNRRETDAQPEPGQTPIMAVLPEHIEKSLLRHIDCVDQLDLLVLLFNSPQTEWSVAAASQVVHCPSGVAQAQLEGLAGRGFLAARVTTDKVYRYSPASEALHQEARALVQTYQERPVTVIRFLYAKPADSVRAFADAFKLKGKE